MMDDVESRIAAFYRTRSGACRDQPYLRFDPDGPFTYLCSPRATGTSLLANRLAGAKLQRRVASRLVRTARYWPDALRVLPGMSRTQVAVPEEGAFELAIGSSRQTTLLSPRQGIASTIGWEGDSGIVEEIETRRQLPTAVNAPRLVETDREFPYFVTEYIDGQTIDDPVADWEYVLDALVQLRAWYESNGVTWMSSDDALAELRIELGEQTEDPVIAEGLERLSSGILPDQLARSLIHGDAHGRNLLVNEETVYILDWETPRDAFIIRDFVTPFIRWLRYGGDKHVFFELFHAQGRGKRIATEYAQEVGPIAWGSTEWSPNIVLFGLFLEMVGRSQENTKWKMAHGLCKMLLE